MNEVLKPPHTDARVKKGQKEKAGPGADSRSEFIEETGLAFEEMGQTRMAGRIFGLLLVADRPMLSSAEISRDLRASKASVSTMTRSLLQSGAIERVALSGDRKDYFRVTSESIDVILEQRMKVLPAFVKLLEKGRSLTSPNNKTGRDCLENMMEFYRWISDEMPAMMERWHRRKKTATRSG